MPDKFIQHSDGNVAFHMSDGARIDIAPLGPSQMDQLMADAVSKAALEEWRKSRPSPPWYAPVLGAAIWILSLTVLVAIFIIGLKWYLRSQGT